MGAISPLHLIIVLIIALVVIGPRKLPETGAALGKAIREFRDASRDDAPAAAGAAAGLTAEVAAIPAEAISATPAVIIDSETTPGG